MDMLKNAIMLIVILWFGLFYYIFSVSKIGYVNKIAFYLKISFLALSFLLAFFEQEFVYVGNLAFGGRAPVLSLILIEILDACIDKKKH